MCRQQFTDKIIIDDYCVLSDFLIFAEDDIMRTKGDIRLSNSDLFDSLMYFFVREFQAGFLFFSLLIFLIPPVLHLPVLIFKCENTIECLVIKTARTDGPGFRLNHTMLRREQTAF